VIVKEFNLQDPQRPAGEINPISELVNMNGTLYISFEGRRNAYETDIELWKSDGTTAGTVIVKDIHPGRGCSYSEPPGCFNGSYPRELTAVNNTLFFSAFDGKSSSRHLWKSDGTEAGTVKLFTPDPSACTASGTILREYWTSVTEQLYLVYL
jgi:ELWxxDGT repeat protein